MAGHDDTGRRDPFDFREPPAPLGGTRPPDPGPPAHSPFEFPGSDDDGRGTGRLRRRVRTWTAALRAADLPSPGAVVVAIAVLVVLALLITALVALL